MVITTLKIILIFIIVLILIYTIRHYVFTLNRLLGKQRHPYINIETAPWPSVTVLVPAHNEELVIANSLDALLRVNYPEDKLHIMVVNDHSTDRTHDIVEEYVTSYPGRISAFHRNEGRRGKSCALRDTTDKVFSDIMVVFDADYIPGVGLIKQLAAPFFDPEVGLVMGRVVPINTGRNLLTRLLDLERAGGYQVDQQARMNLNLVPQYGGTVGGIRMTALRSVGGWREHSLAEDTDITYRALLRGWKSVYQNRSECYEEVPETWPVRMQQITRWARGHNQAMFRYTWKCFSSKNITFREKMDSLLLLGVYIMSPIILLGWIIAITLFYLGENDIVNGPMALLAIVSYGTVGNFAAFFEIATAVYLDRGRSRICLLPFNFFNFLISTLTVSSATLTQLFSKKQATKIWQKTPRFRLNNTILLG